MNAIKPNKRIWTRLAAGVGFALLIIWSLEIWNKHGFCQGWANHHDARAKQLRAEAANPALAPDEARERLIAADLQDLVARKYAAVASQPWRRYPGYPLFTPEEQRLATAMH